MGAKGCISFHYYFHKTNYVKALARLNAANAYAPKLAPKVLWAYYQLCLYSSVCKFDYAGNHWRGQFASTVCLAANGEFEKSAIALNAFKLNKTYKLKQKRLAEALAPFSAALALDALQNPTVHPLLYAALLLKVGGSDVAVSMIQSFDEDNHQALKPEIYLVKNNISGLSQAQKLQNINEFLGFFDLAPLRLKQPELPPSVTNIGMSSTRIAGGLAALEGPLVSVLMTAYNSAEYITSAVESVLAQTYSNIELIIVDDASDDATLDVIKKLALNDQRIKCVSLPCNAGTYVAKTVGLQHAKGEFITCHDSDDWSHPARIERQMQPLLKYTQLVATISDWVRLEENGVPYARGAFPLMRLNPASPLFRRSLVLKKTGVWDLVRTGADSEFIARLKLVFGRDSVKRIRQPLAFGAHRPGSLMTALDTGYTSDNKNNNRLLYWEAWSHWHINMTQQGKIPFIDITTAHIRPFNTPEALQVPESVIRLCLKRSVANAS